MLPKVSKFLIVAGILLVSILPVTAIPIPDFVPDSLPEFPDIITPNPEEIIIETIIEPAVEKIEPVIEPILEHIEDIVFDDDVYDETDDDVLGVMAANFGKVYLYALSGAMIINAEPWTIIKSVISLFSMYAGDKSST